MKPTRIVLLLLFILISTVSISKAQNIIDNKVYRVIAYKMGNNSINSISNYAEVIPPVSFYIPSAFSPNGDGINDTFGVKGEGISNYRMIVYNRWGEVLFESTNPKQQWDGKCKGRPAEQGTYVYQFSHQESAPKGKQDR